MKIISWNMNYWNQKSLHEKAWEYLVNYAAPDIAFLQETIVPEKYVNQTVFLESSTCKDNYKKWGTCIYVNKKLLDICGPLKNVTERFIDENCSYGKQVFVELEYKNTILTLCSLHTNSSDIATIDNHINNIFNDKVLNSRMRNVIIAGDFNADKEMADGTFIKTFNRIKNYYYECCPQKHTQTFFGVSMAERNHYQDDHIFVSNNLSEIVGETFTRNYGKVKNFSDHTILETSLNL